MAFEGIGRVMRLGIYGEENQARVASLNHIN